MKYIGRIFGFAIGFKFGGFFGALFGFWLGSLLDKKLQFGEASNEDKRAIFFDTTFSVMGHIAKSDGQVSSEEIQAAKAVMHRLNLSVSQTKKAQNLFGEGKKAGFDLDAALFRFRNIIGARNQLSMMFLEIQITAALSDGQIKPSEREILLKICSAIGIPQMLFEQIVAMMQAGQHFSGTDGAGGNYQRSTYGRTTGNMDDAHQVLGVKKTDSDAMIKRAYKKLISQHHPDKLQAKGLPDEMLKIAAEKTHTIRKAYELIKQSRGMK